MRSSRCSASTYTHVARQQPIDRSNCNIAVCSTVCFALQPLLSSSPFSLVVPSSLVLRTEGFRNGNGHVAAVAVLAPATWPSALCSASTHKKQPVISGTTCALPLPVQCMSLLLGATCDLAVCSNAQLCVCTACCRQQASSCKC